MNVITIIASTLSDAWFQVLEQTIDHGRKYKITQGSYVDQYRYQLDYVTIHINDPGARPLIPTLPPAMAHLPPPVTQEYIDQYLPYLLTTKKEKNTSYTYGERLVPQMEIIIDRFKKNRGGSNQECISISRPEDIIMEDPPCLRSIACSMYPEECLNGEEQALNFHMYFRSWDAYNGLPANLAGLRLVQEYMADCIGVKAGEITVASNGLHIYDHAIELARLRTAK
jgi:thymidylate synthase